MGRAAKHGSTPGVETALRGARKKWRARRDSNPYLYILKYLYYEYYDIDLAAWTNNEPIDSPCETHRATKKTNSHQASRRNHSRDRQSFHAEYNIGYTRRRKSYRTVEGARGWTDEQEKKLFRQGVSGVRLSVRDTQDATDALAASQGRVRLAEAVEFWPKHHQTLVDSLTVRSRQ
jgi:hypothetical protein